MQENEFSYLQDLSIEEVEQNQHFNQSYHAAAQLTSEALQRIHETIGVQEFLNAANATYLNYSGIVLRFEDFVPYKVGVEVDNDTYGHYDIPTYDGHVYGNGYFLLKSKKDHQFEKKELDQLETATHKINFLTQRGAIEKALFIGAAGHLVTPGKPLKFYSSGFYDTGEVSQPSRSFPKGSQDFIIGYMEYAMGNLYGLLERSIVFYGKSFIEVNQQNPNKTENVFLTRIEGDSTAKRIDLLKSFVNQAHAIDTFSANENAVATLGQRVMTKAATILGKNYKQ